MIFFCTWQIKLSFSEVLIPLVDHHVVFLALPLELIKIDFQIASVSQVDRPAFATRGRNPQTKAG